MATGGPIWWQGVQPTTNFFLVSPSGSWASQSAECTGSALGPPPVTRQPESPRAVEAGVVSVFVALPVSAGARAAGGVAAGLGSDCRQPAITNASARVRPAGGTLMSIGSFMGADGASRAHVFMRAT